VVIRSATLALSGLALLAAGCGGSSGGSSSTPSAKAPPPPAAASASCANVGLDGKPQHAMPANVPVPGDAKVYESQGPYGSSYRYFAVLDGGPSDYPRQRDDATDALTEAGYKFLAKDQEQNAEAESHLTGKHQVDIQVTSLCKGKNRIRYTVS
jgi:hypothetical protein